MTDILESLVVFVYISTCCIGNDEKWEMAYPLQTSLWRKCLLICHAWFNNSWGSIKNHFWEEKCGMDFPGTICGGDRRRDFPDTCNNACKTVKLLVQGK